MEDKKVLGQFHAKISKAKILYDTTSATNQKLRREANQLQREFENMKNQRQNAQRQRQDFKQKMDNAQRMNKEQTDKCFRETKQLNDLRNTNKQLQRQKTYCEADLRRHNLLLQQLMKRHQQLQATANSLTDRLNQTTAQKNVLQEQYNKTLAAIDKYNKNIKDLTDQINNARHIISTNTVPVHKIYEQNQRKNKQ